MRSAAIPLSLLLAIPLPVCAAELSGARAQELRNLVIQDCGSCHGLRLKGGLGTPLRPENLKGRTPQGIARVILKGIPDTAMPPWEPLLTEAEALWIAQELQKGLVHAP